MFKKFERIIIPHLNTLRSLKLQTAFLHDPARETSYEATAAGLTLNYAQQFIEETFLKDMANFLEKENFHDRIESMFRGDKINFTENRPVLHTALRSSETLPLIVDGIDVRTEMARELAKMNVLVNAFYAGNITGATGKAITDLVNIGIGGSDLGPRMVVRALRPDDQGHVKVHFISNVDGTDLFEVLQNLNPATTCFIVASKSFTTQETLLNAKTAKAWLAAALPQQNLSSHFIGITSNPAKAIAWGILEDRIFTMWDFIGGRYSLWSTIGLPIAVSIGNENFKKILEGAAEMDQHFRTAPWQKNLPVLLAIFSLLNQNFLGAESHAILPYDQTLELLPAYLQQADMESNGKRVTRAGHFVDYQTGVALWGGVGTNGQHAFHQLLHQGMLMIPIDLILPLNPRHPFIDHHRALKANCYGQKEALLKGRSLAASYHELLESGLSPQQAEQLAPHKVIPGNRPVNLITFDRLSPKRLGALIALYEHKIFMQSLIWDINAFDQWGVELGKTLAEAALQKFNPE